MNLHRSNYYSGDDGISSLSAAEYDAIQKECMHYEDIRSVSIEALKIVQRHRGWISDDIIQLIAKILNISVADLEGVATFYNQIFRQPVGRHIIRYCDSMVCYMFNCEKIKNMFMDILDITVGNTTVDNRFTLLPTCCIGKCAKAPVVIIDDDEYYHIIPEKVIKLLECYL